MNKNDDARLERMESALERIEIQLGEVLRGRAEKTKRFTWREARTQLGITQSRLRRNLRKLKIKNEYLSPQQIARLRDQLIINKNRTPPVRRNSA